MIVAASQIRFIRTMSWTLAALFFTLGGCPLQAPLSEDAPQAAAADASTTLNAGTFWVERQGGTLAAFSMPARRGDAGAWTTLEASATAWFSGSGLYTLSQDGTWSREASTNGLLLDEWVQLHDPKPALND